MSIDPKQFAEQWNAATGAEQAELLKAIGARFVPGSGSYWAVGTKLDWSLIPNMKTVIIPPGYK